MIDDAQVMHEYDRQLDRFLCKRYLHHAIVFFTINRRRK